MPHIDLECGDDQESICFSDADEGSCYSQSYSTADDDDCASNGGISGSGSRRASSDYSVEIGDGRNCRICHLGLESRNPMESGWVAIELGCSCKDDLGAAHRSCAETWFKIKGNKLRGRAMSHWLAQPQIPPQSYVAKHEWIGDTRTCEICNSVARNVFGGNEIESIQQTNETNIAIADAVSASIPPPTETRSWLNGHRLVNFLLACMVLAFVISWLFHFKIPS
ncbi:hypothetical protein RHSIM_Rhsim04G0164400 [Rhododendron simsii]|uniref:RING-CH-type domain-containing protein n=1 Tax=Rhododendron simsii TaxID=118357 RepID=A0A834H212_RHOSS|nr:hypothetical protein RHSIM_Rhsim04G0164400 [Rhododendron simsii]